MIRRSLSHLGTALKDLLTAKDGVTYAPSRVYWCLGALQFLLLSAWAVIVNKADFAPSAYGEGFGAILIAGGVGVWITRKTEPSQ